MTPDYVTVYQISKGSSDWSFALAGTIPFVASTLLTIGKRRFGWRQPHWAFLFVMFCFGVAWLCTAGISVVDENLQAFDAFQGAHYSIIEGTVSDFHPMPYQGHRNECFTVQDKEFCYSDYVIAPGFRNTASHGGPIRLGLPVRIAYVGDTILRLEIPKQMVARRAETLATTRSAQQAWQSLTNNDPVERRMTIAFLFTMVFWTFWWNVGWQSVMRLWVRPPNSPWVQYAFRAFFALNFLGALWRLAAELHSHPIAQPEIVPTIKLIAITSAVIALMSALGMLMVLRRERKNVTSEI